MESDRSIKMYKSNGALGSDTTFTLTVKGSPVQWTLHLLNRTMITVGYNTGHKGVPGLSTTFGVVVYIESVGA